jgi:peptidoglycan hydrolase CwlO-like protein
MIEKSLLVIYQEADNHPELSSLNHLAGVNAVFPEGYRRAFVDSLSLQQDRERLINLCDSKDKEIHKLVSDNHVLRYERDDAENEVECFKIKISDKDKEIEELKKEINDIYKWELGDGK